MPAFKHTEESLTRSIRNMEVRADEHELIAKAYRELIVKTEKELEKMREEESYE